MSRFCVIVLLVTSMFFAGAAQAGPKKIYLINGLLSKLLGYGLTNLSKKIPSARHFKFAGGVTRATIDGIIADASRAYKADPTTRISLIGISQGGRAVATIAAALHKKGVRVHYMGVVEASSPTTVYANVRKVDNFICSGASCSRNPVRLAAGNSVTRVKVYSLDTGHVDSGNHPTMHRRVISQVN